jgi:hypothetical protein
MEGVGLVSREGGEWNVRMDENTIKMIFHRLAA